MEELYNLKEDPYEMDNLAYQEEYACKKEEMIQGLIRKQEETEDTDCFICK